MANINIIDIYKDLNKLREHFLKTYDYKKLDDVFKNSEINDYPLIENFTDTQVQKVLDDVSLFEILNKLFTKYDISFKGEPQEFEKNFIKFINGEEIDVEEDEILIYEIALKVYGLGFNIMWKYFKDRMDLSLYDKNYCPVCGFDFEYAYIDEDGKKFLVCGLCNYAWRYPRIKCPYCETEDQKKLSYIQFEEDYDFLRLYKCDSCNNLHKVLIVEKIDNYSNLTDAHIDTIPIEFAYLNSNK